MKLNIVNVLNTIAAEEASMVLLNDANASWNKTAVDDWMNIYEMEMFQRRMLNEQSFDLCDWLMSRGESYENVTFYDIVPFNDWMKEQEKVNSRYYAIAA